MNHVVETFIAVCLPLAVAFPFFRKKEESIVQVMINTLRANMDKLKHLDDSQKEKLAEPLRNLLGNQNKFAYDTSKSDPRKGKKLIKEAESDEDEARIFFAEFGVGRISPENQRKIDAMKAEIKTLVEQSKQQCKEIDLRSFLDE